jgi:Amt family ammonium transporter
MVKKAFLAMIVGFVLAFVAYSIGQSTNPPDTAKAALAAPAAIVAPAPAAAPATPPPSINTGDTAWMIVATALVMLMTLPGLALFYGGIAKRKDTLNVIAMSFVTFCIVSLLWVVYGYTFAFGDDVHGIIGNAHKFMMSGITVNSISGTIPELIFVVFQLTFAAITVALASGAYIERMKFSAWILFTILWMTLVYVPIAHWVWGNGFLAKLGALDFAGGTVVHINAGIAALIGALFLGKRKEPNLIPNNLVATVTGAGLLWFGWFGFNAGSACAANNQRFLVWHRVQ